MSDLSEEIIYLQHNQLKANYNCKLDPLHS